jgi:hypothetical protein
MSPGTNRQIYFIEPVRSKYIYKGIYVFTLKPTAVDRRTGAPQKYRYMGNIQN